MTITPAEINAFLPDAFPGTGNECLEVGPDWALAHHVVHGDNLRPGGYVSGPTQFSLADAVLWYALFGAVGIEPMALTSASCRSATCARGRHRAVARPTCTPPAAATWWAG